MKKLPIIVLPLHAPPPLCHCGNDHAYVIWFTYINYINEKKIIKIREKGKLLGISQSSCLSAQPPSSPKLRFKILDNINGVEIARTPDKSCEKIKMMFY